MRKKVEYYNGNQITKKVLKKITLIELKRWQEGITKFPLVSIKTLDELCEIHNTNPEQEHIVLGEDWYIIYTKMGDYELEINEWVAINNVENKLIQTMEMFNTLKKILIENEQSDIYAILRHSTSYKFYKKLLEKNYLDEGYDIVEFEDSIPELEKIKKEILTKYDSLEDYLLDENREKYEESSIEDYIYHYVCFNINEEFKNRYKRSGR